jgi:hypothetical protein
MSGTIAPCIYCGVPVDSQCGDGDHVMPAELGRFKGEFHFRRICRAHNSLFGKSEEQLLRCAPESFFRRLAHPARLRDARGQKWVGAHGMRPPKFVVPRGDHSEMVRPSTSQPGMAEPIDQLVLIGADGNERHLRLYPEMTANTLRSRIKALDVVPTTSYLHTDERYFDKYIGLLKEVCPQCELFEKETQGTGIYWVKFRATFTYHADYWRAIAKIAFHYYLVNSRRGLNGDEPEFDDIRHFLLCGGDHKRFFGPPQTQFLLPFGELPSGKALLPQNWVHLLAADESQNSAIVMVSLFIGPLRPPRPYYITLGRFRSELVVPGAVFSHAYQYDSALGGSFAGRVDSISLTKLR